jgi:hypothetical protein
MVRRGRSRLPLGVLGMVALIGAVESRVARCWLDVGERRALAWRFSGEAAERSAARADVLCLGDSLVKLGVQPLVMERRLGRPVYNVAVPGGQASSTFFLFRRAIGAGARPSAVVVDFHPNLLAAAPRFNVDVWAELLEPIEAIDLAHRARDPDLLVSNMVGLALPTYKDRHGIRQVISARLVGETPPLRDDHAAFLRNWRINAGATLSPDVSTPGLGEWTTSGGAEGRRWKPHRANRAYLVRFLDLAASRGVRVVWLLPPIGPDWQAHRDGLGIEADYDGFLRSLVDRYPNLVVLDGRRSGYDARAFRDATHLNRRGALVLSDDLGELLSRFPEPASASERWLALPAYRERPEPLPLEDVEQSRVVARRLDRERIPR